MVVPSPATSEVFEATTLTSLAPMFSNGSASSISLRDGDAVLGHGRAAERLVENDVAAGGAERHGHGLGQVVDTPSMLAAGGRRRRAVALPRTLAIPRTRA